MGSRPDRDDERRPSAGGGLAESLRARSRRHLYAALPRAAELPAEPGSVGVVGRGTDPAGERPPLRCGGGLGRGRGDCPQAAAASRGRRRPGGGQRSDGDARARDDGRAATPGATAVRLGAAKLYWEVRPTWL